MHLTVRLANVLFLIPLMFALLSCGQNADDPTYAKAFESYYGIKFDFNSFDSLEYSKRPHSSYLVQISDGDVLGFLNERFNALNIRECKTYPTLDMAKASILTLHFNEGNVKKGWVCLLDSSSLLIEFQGDVDKKDLHFSAALPTNWAEEVCSTIEVSDPYYAQK